MESPSYDTPTHNRPIIINIERREGNKSAVSVISIQTHPGFKPKSSVETQVRAPSGSLNMRSATEGMDNLPGRKVTGEDLSAVNMGAGMYASLQRPVVLASSSENCAKVLQLMLGRPISA